MISKYNNIYTEHIIPFCKIVLDKGYSLQEGEFKAKIETARNLLDILDIETIAATVGLPLEEIRKLKSDKQIM